MRGGGFAGRPQPRLAFDRAPGEEAKRVRLDRILTFAPRLLNVGLELDEEIEFRRLHHRQVDGLLALEDAIYYQPSLTIVLS